MAGKPCVLSALVPGRDDVTVVIPCFNHGRFLGEAVASVAGQEGGAPRVIVVDDGSTDRDTEEAISTLEGADGAEVEVIRQENAGPAAARNSGFAKATTGYVLPLDADDRLPPGALSALVGALDRDSEAAFSYGVMRYFGDWSGEVKLPDYDPYRLLYRPITGWLGLVRRSVWEELGGFDPELQGYEDWDFVLGSIERGWHGRQLRQVVLDYRKHDRSGLEADRRRHRALLARLRSKHADLYARSDELAERSDLGPVGRLVYRTWWAWRPLPASWERALYSLLFRG
jgi:glycosyltransferase involved in cell wall biosynthesis